MPRTFLMAGLLAGALLAGCADATPDVDVENVDTPLPTGTALADSVDLPETNYYAIQTPAGRMVVRLYDETPIHRDNFKRLAVTGFYDSTRFHRVIDSFMIQGGDPNSRDDDFKNDGQGGPGYTLDAEIRRGLLHKRGALAAARMGDQVNPERKSSGSQFYIVDGQPVPPEMMAQIQPEVVRAAGEEWAFTAEQREMYATEGGTPFLDGQYTVFGELVEGFDVLDAIAGLPTARKMRGQAEPWMVDQPPHPMYMTVTPLPDYTPPAE